MASFEPSYLGAHSHPLPRGPRVRLRLAQIRDASQIRSFLAAHGATSEDLKALWLIRCDPRQRVVVCATAFVDGIDTVVGLGSIEVGAEAPDLIVVNSALTDGLEELITQALLRRAEAIAERRAA